MTISAPAAQLLGPTASEDPVGTIFESLPVTRTHAMIVGASALGYLSDAFDTYLVGFAMPVIATQWGLTLLAAGSLASSAMWGMFVGSILWGPLADRFGRKPALAGTVLGFSLLTGLTGLANSTSQFLLLRFLTGVFLGGMLPVASVMVAEQFGARNRGRFVALPPVFWPAGLFAAAGVSYLLIPHYGWRAVFYTGAFPALLSIFILRKLPESPRWLAARGQPERAARELQRFGIGEEETRGLQNFRPKAKGAMAEVLFRPPYRGRLLLTVSVLFFGFFGYYGFLLWLPSILAVKFGISLVQTFEYTALVGVCAILGKITAVFTIDRWGRKQLFYFGYGLAGVAFLAFGLLSKPVSLLIGACVLSFLLEEAAAGCVVLPTELFPSQVRGTANSWASAAGKLAAAISPLAFGFLMAKQMYYAIFVSMAIFLWLACLMVFIIDVETKGKALEDIGAS
jgi:MFS transporter, putative metabolite:H+ symporter